MPTLDLNFAHLAPSRLTVLQQLDGARHSGEVPVLFFNTDDVFLNESGQPRRLVELITERLYGSGLVPVVYSPATGARVDVPLDRGLPHLGGLPGATDSVHESIRALIELVRQPAQRCAVILDYADHIAPRTPVGAEANPTDRATVELIHRAGTDPGIDRSGGCLVLIDRGNGVHDLIDRHAAGFRRVTVPLPGRIDRLQMLDVLSNRHLEDPDRFAGFPPELGADALADLTGGLRLDDLYRLSREAAAESGVLDPERCRDRRARTIRELVGDIAQVHDALFGFDAVAGVDHARDEIRDRSISGHWPKGFVFAGVPGVGKSFIVPAIGRELHRPVISLRNVRSMWVGESERRLERFLAIVSSLAPCIVWADELDQLLGQRSTDGSGDSGTSERLLARLWEFTGDRAAGRDVLFIGTTNRPDLLDLATLSRFVVLPFLHPTPDQVASLLPVLASQIGRSLDVGVDLENLAHHPRLRRTSARALLDILDTAATWSELDPDRASDGSVIYSTQLEAALDDYRPSEDDAQQELIALRALDMTVHQHLLPWRSRGGRRDCDVPDYVEGLIDENGTLDTEALHRRLEQLVGAVEVRRWQRQI